MDTTGAYNYNIGNVVKTAVTFSVTENDPDGTPSTYNLTVVKENGKYVIKNDDGDTLPII